MALDSNYGLNNVQLHSLLGYVSKLVNVLHPKPISNYPKPLSFFEIFIAHAKFAKLIMSCVPKSTLNYLKEPSFLKIIISNAKT